MAGISSIEAGSCPNCGPAGIKISSPVSVGGVEIPDAYCGVCGVNWGRKRKEDKKQRKGERRTQQRGGGFKRLIDK
jgi:hypothetical protein